MRTRRYVRVARAAGEAFSTAAAVTSLMFDVIGGFVRNGIPGVVKWVVTGIVGLIAGCFGGRNAARVEEERDRAREARRNQHIQLVADVKQELHDIKDQLDQKYGGAAVVSGRVRVAYNNLDNMHRQLAANDRFFRDARANSRLSDSKLDNRYGSSSDSDQDLDEKDVKQIQLASFRN